MTTPTLEPVALNSRRAGPTHARFGVMAFIVGLAAVTYLDRACIGKLAPSIRKDLGFSETNMSWIFASFAISYAMFELPTAWWAQRRGTRRVLTRIVLWWSVLTLATAGVISQTGFEKLGFGAWAWGASFWMMMSIRFLFGLGEAGAWPCAAASYAKWIPQRERGIAQGLLFAGAHLSGGLTPLLVVVLLNDVHLHWRAIFVLFGMVGFVWAGAWYAWFRDDPSEHPGVGEEELQAIVSDRRPATHHDGGMEYWIRVLTHRNVIALSVMYLANAYTYYFCITWLSTYVEDMHKIKGVALAIAGGLPLTLSVVGDIFGGLTTDWLTKRFGPRVGRVGLGAACYTIAAALILVAILVKNPWVAIISLSVAVASIMFTLGAAWSIVIEIGGNHTGMVGAVMNTAGNTAAIFSPLVTIYVKNNWSAWWNAPLQVIMGLVILGIISWCFIDPRKRVFD